MAHGGHIQTLRFSHLCRAGYITSDDVIMAQISLIGCLSEAGRGTPNLCGEGSAGPRAVAPAALALRTETQEVVLTRQLAVANGTEFQGMAGNAVTSNFRTPQGY